MIKKLFICTMFVFFLTMTNTNAETIVTESTTNSKVITEGNMEEVEYSSTVNMFKI